MSFFDDNSQLENKIDSLPESVKAEINRNGTQVKSAEELDELVRRIRSAQTGRIF